MRCVNVLLDVPSQNPPPIYTYSCPEDVGTPGQRVLVWLGSKVLEGWILNEAKAPSPGIQIKPIIKILDDEVFLNPSLLKLAEWVAEVYVCPLNIVLKAMVPAYLRDERSNVIKINRDVCLGAELSICPEHIRYFMLQLNENGPMTWQEALQMLDEAEINKLAGQNWICLPTSRRTLKESRDTLVYRLEPFDQTKKDELGRAPRQLQALEYLEQIGPVTADDLEKRFGSRVISVLMTKGFLKSERAFEPVEPDYSLSSEQEEVLQELLSCLALPKQEKLLYGVTGSGKTEIYLRLAQEVIKRRQGVIVLLPEIALTRHLTEVFTRRIPNMAVLHSRMAPGERGRLWASISRGEVDLVLGTRLAIFAPLPRLGLIIIDEEQESTFKQEEIPRYHAREVARRRTEIEGGLLLLGSATPSLESFSRAMVGQIGLLHLPERPGHASLPGIEIEDMRKTTRALENRVLSPRLKEYIRSELEQGRQSILFINRRGYSPFTICRSCGQAILCKNCSVSMSYHRQTDTNRCHYCGFSHKPPDVCPACGSRFLQQQGIGTQRVEEEVCEEFPMARVARLDLDSSSKGRQQAILQQMSRGEIDILVGTQMVAKGLDFPRVSLVGIVDADALLNLPDFRAAERGFQLMVQAAGRAGRGAVAGKVLVQTCNPDNYVVQRAVDQDYIGFYKEEMLWRQALNYPPFTHILRLVISALNEKDAWNLARSVYFNILDALDSREEAPVVLGPAPCPLSRVRKRYRFQIMVKSANILLLSSIGRYIINRDRIAGGRVEIDVDPLVTM